MKPQLIQVLRRRRDTIVDIWYEAIAPTGFTALTAAEVHRRLSDLTDQAIIVLLSDVFEPPKARAIGSTLAGMHYLNPETLRRAQEVLAYQLLEDLTDHQAAALRARLAELLAEIAAGFFERARDTILQEQEEIKGALIMERKQVEEALRKSEASLAEAQGIAHVGHWDYDWISNRLRWSDEIYRIFGISKQESWGTFRDYFERVHPEDRGLLDTTTPDLLEGGPISLEHRIVRPDGEVRVVQLRLQFVFDDVPIQLDAWAGRSNPEGADPSADFLNRQLREVEERLGQLPGKPVRVVGTVQDISERKALENRLEHQASHDPLTDLPNRSLFLDRLREALGRDKRRKGNVAVLYLDLDNFKLVNDSFGHSVGDWLLTKIATRLRTCVRAQDLVARFGGDEFTFLVEDDTGGAGNAIRVADRIVRELYAPFQLENQDVFVTASIGIASSAIKDESPEDVIRNADTAMYRAKATSKATYEVFEPSMSVDALAHLRLTSDLRRALEREEFKLYYQPIIEIATGEIVGMEALVRWEHPERGLLRPNEFLPLAEDSGMIIHLGQWVIDEVCRQTRLWQDVRGSAPLLRVSMNLSARELLHPKLVSCIIEGLREHALDPKGLELEITENVALEYEDVLVETLTKLKDLGVRVAIDDFGTGYSSLSHLYHLPIDALKIDQSFVEGLEEDPRARKIAAATISLARTLDLKGIAEGVETAEQLSHLQRLRCELAQGDYISAPLTSEAATALLAT